MVEVDPERFEVMVGEVLADDLGPPVVVGPAWRTSLVRSDDRRDLCANRSCHVRRQGYVQNPTKG